MTAEDWLHRLFKPTSSGLQAYENTLLCLAAVTETFGRESAEPTGQMTESALLMPDVSTLLGFGDALVPSMAPSWLQFPILRMAHIVQTSSVCQKFGISAARLPFGGPALVAAAFGVRRSSQYAEQYASYILTGGLSKSIELYMSFNLDAIYTILKFRDTQTGVQLRKEILASLDTDAGSEFPICLDAGVTKGLSAFALDEAKAEFDGLMVASSISPTPAIWAPSEDSGRTMGRWRTRSREIFLDLLKKDRKKTTDKCLCGSGEAAKFCCLEILQR